MSRGKLIIQSQLHNGLESEHGSRSHAAWLTRILQADWDAVAAEYGYKDGPLAKSKFQAAMLVGKNVGSIPASEPRGNSGKRKAGAAGEDAHNDEPITPPRKRGRPPKAVKTENGDGPDDSPLRRKSLEQVKVKQEQDGNEDEDTVSVKKEKDSDSDDLGEAV